MMFNLNVVDEDTLICRVPVTHSNGVTVMLEAVWTGGPYIEMGVMDTGVKVEVINVWDYENGGLRLPFGLTSLERTLAEWMFDYVPEDDCDGEWTPQTSFDQLVEDMVYNWSI